MFSIKYASDFSEQLFHSVDVITVNQNQASPHYGLAFISRTPQSPELHHLLGADVEGVDGAQPEKGQRGTAFVMNENGKTVARYNL